MSTASRRSVFTDIDLPPKESTEEEDEACLVEALKQSTFKVEKEASMSLSGMNREKVDAKTTSERSVDQCESSVKAICPGPTTIRQSEEIAISSCKGSEEDDTTEKTNSSSQRGDVESVKAICPGPPGVAFCSDLECKKEIVISSCEERILATTKSLTKTKLRSSRLVTIVENGKVDQEENSTLLNSTKMIARQRGGAIDAPADVYFGTYEPSIDTSSIEEPKTKSKSSWASSDRHSCQLSSVDPPGAVYCEEGDDGDISYVSSLSKSQYRRPVSTRSIANTSSNREVQKRSSELSQSSFFSQSRGMSIGEEYGSSYQKRNSYECPSSSSIYDEDKSTMPSQSSRRKSHKYSSNNYEREPSSSRYRNDPISRRVSSRGYSVQCRKSISPESGFVRVKTSFGYYEDISFGIGEAFNADSTLFDIVKVVKGHPKYNKNTDERIFKLSWAPNCCLSFRKQDMREMTIGSLYRKANLSSNSILQIECATQSLPQYLVEYGEDKCGYISD